MKDNSHYIATECLTEYGGVHVHIGGEASDVGMIDNDTDCLVVRNARVCTDEETQCADVRRYRCGKLPAVSVKLDKFEEKR